MGHYRSEMISEEEEANKVSQERQRLLNRAQKIQEAIDKKGVAMVLAEILEDSTMASIRYHG